MCRLTCSLPDRHRGGLRQIFIEGTFKLETGDSERIAVDHVTNASQVASGGSSARGTSRELSGSARPMPLTPLGGGSSVPAEIPSHVVPAEPAERPGGPAQPHQGAAGLLGRRSERCVWQVGRGDQGERILMHPSEEVCWLHGAPGTVPADPELLRAVSAVCHRLPLLETDALREERARVRPDSGGTAWRPCGG